MYGGEVVNHGAAGDLWEWSSKYRAWRERTPSPLPPTWPNARTFVSLNYMGGGHMLLLDNQSPAFLRWNVNTNLWQSLTAPMPAAFPPARAQPISAWDRTERGLVVVGAGVPLGKEIRTDTWQWSP
jgi:hypothetical protein